MEYGFCYFCLPILILVVGLLATPAVLGAREMLLGMRSRERRRVATGGALLAASVVLAALVFLKPVQSARFCVQAPYLSPPTTFEDEDLVGAWRARYDGRVDTLILRADGTFKQVYADGHQEDDVHETPWNEWRVERYPDGRARVHLDGARFYEQGLTIAEQGGCYRDWTFYDQVAEEYVTTPDTLVLNLRVYVSGEPLLLHLSCTSSVTAGLLDCERSIFRPVEAP